jgi:hypothetical protein
MQNRIVTPIVSILLLIVGVAWVGYQFGAESIVDGIRKFSPLTVSLVLSALLINAFTAAYRFKVLSSATGHPVRFRHAMAAVGAGSLGSALFFQLAGQLVARGFVMRQRGMSFSAVVAVTLYERIAATLLSAVLALIGALYIFGRIYLDRQAGGLVFIKIIAGLTAAAAAGAALGYGSHAKRVLKPYLTRRLLSRCLQLFGLALLVQIPMMAAYVAAAHGLSPQTTLTELAAASAIVMLAASIPISFAGWGVRELSAMIALGAIGIASNDALIAAVIVGVGSMLSMAVVLTIGAWGRAKAYPAAETPKAQSIDYAQALAWCLPLVAAVFVLFQIYIPVGSGLLNVNLADPVALLAGALLIVQAVSQRRLPQWRVGHVNLAALVTTVALGGSLLLGAYRFGFTDWAVVNRFLGWFVLLAFAATGALIVNAGGREAFRILALTYAAATAAVALLEFSLVLTTAAGFAVPSAVVRPGNLEAFSQNHNFFAFQLLMALSAALVFVREQHLRILLATVMLLAFWFAGSRSGWIAVTCVLAASVYLRVATLKEIALSVAAAAGVAAAVYGLHVLVLALQSASGGAGVPAPDQILPSAASTSERMVTILGGWQMFVEHPVFGAGLGAFRNQLIPSSSGVPLVIHSTALWLLAELGLVGFLCFAAPALYVWGIEWRRAPVEPASAVIVLCLVAFAVMSAPADMVYQRTFWLLIGAALAVPRLPRHYGA